MLYGTQPGGQLRHFRKDLKTATRLGATPSPRTLVHSLKRIFCTLSMPYLWYDSQMLFDNVTRSPASKPGPGLAQATAAPRPGLEGASLRPLSGADYFLVDRRRTQRPHLAARRSSPPPGQAAAPPRPQAPSQAPQRLPKGDNSRASSAECHHNRD